MSDSYWTKVMEARKSRRRLLATAGGGAIGGALLLACGGGGDAKSGGGASSLLTPVVDETKNVKRGGTLKFIHPFDQQSMDPMFTSLPNQLPVNAGYSQLFFYPGDLLGRNKGVLEGDLAESWEFSGDKLTLSIKLSDKAHFNTKAPTSGRQVDADDVVYSWKRFKEIGTRRSDLSHELNPDAVVESITAPDKRTVVIKLSEPHSTVTHQMANTQAGSYFIVPIEVETNNLDLRREHYGSGPWILDNYTTSVSYTFKKNPGFGQDKRGLPYMDQFDAPIILEYAQWLAQFRAGQMHYMTGNASMRAEDIPPTKKDLPQLNMYNIGITSERSRTWFGQRPNSPFRDERVRQAWVKAWDRDLFIDSRFNTSGYEREGIEMPTYWNTALASNSWEGYWLDPRSKEFGENAKYFTYDLAEAKKLMAAAGFANGFDTVLTYPRPGYPATFYSTMEQLLGMSQELGIKASVNVVGLNVPEWRTPYEYSDGDFDGIAGIPDSGGAEPANYLFVRYNSKGSSFFGWDAEGNSTKGGDPKLDDLTLKMRGEFDEKKRIALIQEFQKYEAKKMYEPMAPGGTNVFEIAWPAVRGVGLWDGASNRNFATIWLDQTKAPFV